MITDVLTAALRDALVALAVDPLPETINLEQPANRDHGDWSSNVALATAKKAGRNPRELGQQIADHLNANLPTGVERVDIAGPRLRQLPSWPTPGCTTSLRDVVRLQASTRYGRSKTGRQRHQGQRRVRQRQPHRAAPRRPRAGCGATATPIARPCSRRSATRSSASSTSTTAASRCRPMPESLLGTAGTAKTPPDGRLRRRLHRRVGCQGDARGPRRRRRRSSGATTTPRQTKPRCSRPSASRSTRGTASARWSTQRHAIEAALDDLHEARCGVRVRTVRLWLRVHRTTATTRTAC